MTTVIQNKFHVCQTGTAFCAEETFALFVLEEELQASGDQRSFRHVKAVFAQESLTNPDSLPLAVALMAEEDTRSSVSGFTRVDWTTGEPREDPTGGVMRRDAVVEEVQPPSGELAVTVSGTPDTKEAVLGGQATGEATSDLEGNLR